MVWNLVPDEIKCPENLRDLKITIKECKPTCRCITCKTCLQGDGLEQGISDFIFF